MIEESTVKTHIKRILLKLDLRDRIHAPVVRALAPSWNRRLNRLAGVRAIEPEVSAREAGSQAIATNQNLPDAMASRT